MLTKDKVRKTVDRLPENFTVDQIVEELVVLNKIEEYFYHDLPSHDCRQILVLTVMRKNLR
jgi:hypothetical protein